MIPKLAARATALLALTACAPDLSPPAWLVDRPRLLAVVADAPEVSPGQGSTFRALAAGPQGELDLTQATWSLCTSPLPLTESGSIAQACLADLQSAGQGATVQLATSGNACSLFGPVGSATTQRARSPDATGGYYQPVRLELSGMLAFAEERLLCPLAQASFQVSVQYQQSYRANSNPRLGSLALSALNGDSVSPDSVPANTQLTLSLAWEPASNESFPVLDPATLSLVNQDESMRVSWFATGGVLEQSQSGPDDSGVESAVRWSAPSSLGPVHLWAVLRDSRGGAAWAAIDANVVTTP